VIDRDEEVRAAIADVFGVSWREHQHLSFDAPHPTVFLNVVTMADDLSQAFEDYEALLRSDAEARERFVRRRRREREVSPRGGQLEAWRTLLDDRRHLHPAHP
jgi:hypothetical protein